MNYLYFIKNNILHMIIILLLILILYYSYKNNISSEIDDILSINVHKNQLKTNIVIKDFHLRKNDKSSNLLLSFIYDVNTPYESIIDIFEIEEFIKNYEMRSSYQHGF